MGGDQSKSKREAPSADHDATLYDFPGRGMSDQLRWLMAYTGVSWTQRVVATRERFNTLCESKQLPFAQLPLLQIDGMDLVQSQAIVRYLAQRGNLLATSSKDQVKCDMLAESFRDMLDAVSSAPFDRINDKDSEAAIGSPPKEGRLYSMIRTFMMHAMRLEFCIANNKGSDFLVGQTATYVDVLCVHLVTWFVEECGPRVMDRFERLVTLQHRVFENEGLREFLRDDSRYYPIGDEKYVNTVNHVMQINTAAPTATATATATAGGNDGNDNDSPQQEQVKTK